jgi:hypothetical protein
LFCFLSGFYAIFGFSNNKQPRLNKISVLLLLVLLRVAVHFNAIGKVDAKNTGGRTTYRFTDNNATGKKLFYRLQTSFTNGNNEYSNIQMLQTNSSTEIMVFPNPATNVLQLRLNISYATMHVQIINGAGQLVKQYPNLSAANQVLH